MPGPASGTSTRHQPPWSSVMSCSRLSTSTRTLFFSGAHTANSVTGASFRTSEGVAARLTRAGGGGDDSGMETLLPILVGLATVPFILGIKAYRRSLLRRGQVREADRRPLIPLGIGLVALGVLFFSVNSGVADKTLFEAQVAGTGDRAPTELTFTVPVEHPGARHEFDVDPREDGGSVDAPIDVAVRLTDPAGAVVVDEHRTLDIHDDSDNSAITHRVWDSWDRDVTPTRAGDYLLTVTVLSPHVPQVHVWVGDDDKTDGHRIAGY